MKKAVGKKTITNGGGSLFMKKIISIIMVLAMVFIIGVAPVSAYNNYNYNNNYNYDYNNDQNATTNSTYVPNYSGNWSMNYNNNYNNYNSYNNTSTYGYYGNNGYYDYYGNYFSILNNYQPDSWFMNQYGDRFQFYWIKSPQAPALRGDYFRAVYDLQMSYNNNPYSYPTGNPQRFADYNSVNYNNYNNNYYNNNYNNNYNNYNNNYNNNYTYNNSYYFGDSCDYSNYYNYSQMIAILNGTGGGYSNANILDGREVNGQAYLDFNSAITRSEAAKLCIRTNQAWWGLNTVRNSMIFNDTQNHWAKNEIAQAYAVGIVDGVGGNYFNPNATLTNQEMLKVFCSVVDRSNRYGIQQFIDMVNSGNVARITEVYWNNNSDEDWRFTRDTVYMNVNDTFELKSVMNGWNNTIKFTSSNTNVATVSSNGIITPKGTGTTVITAKDSYGVSDSITIDISSAGSNRPTQTPSSSLYFTQSSITIQRGNSINLSNYLENASGSVSYTTNSNNCVTISGSTATGINVGSTTVTARDNYGSATIIIQVVDNNVSTNLNISVDFADNNTAGNLNFIVRGIDSSCTVKVNDNSNYSLVEQYREATWGKYAVQGLYPEGGTDTIVVCVYRNGQKIYESQPYVFYTGD